MVFVFWWFHPFGVIVLAGEHPYCSNRTKGSPLGDPIIYIINARTRAREGLSITDYEEHGVFFFVDARSFTITDDLAYRGLRFSFFVK